VPAGDNRKKNTHASCWHVDLENDIRSLQSIEPNARWFFTAHHELGHGYYFKAYSRPEVPYLCRTGAAPGFHEGVGELISLASSRRRPAVRNSAMPRPRRTSTTIRPITITTRLRRCLNSSCTTTSRAKSCISRRNPVTTPITSKSGHG